MLHLVLKIWKLYSFWKCPPRIRCPTYPKLFIFLFFNIYWWQLRLQFASERFEFFKSSCNLFCYERNSIVYLLLAINWNNRCLVIPITKRKWIWRTLKSWLKSKNRIYQSSFSWNLLSFWKNHYSKDIFLCNFQYCVRRFINLLCRLEWWKGTRDYASLRKLIKNFIVIERCW